MPSEAYTIIVADGSPVFLDGGTLQISDGSVFVSAAEYSTWGVGKLIINSKLSLDLRGADLSDESLKKSAE